MHRQSSKLKFAKSVSMLLLAAGATIVTDNVCTTEMAMDTIHGKLKIHLPKEKSAVCTVYARFEDVDLAKTGLSHRSNFNPHSGKYNIHEYQEHLALAAVSRDIIPLAIPVA